MDPVALVDPPMEPAAAVEPVGGSTESLPSTIPGSPSQLLASGPLAPATPSEPLYLTPELPESLPEPMENSGDGGTQDQPVEEATAVEDTSPELPEPVPTTPVGPTPVETGPMESIAVEAGSGERGLEPFFPPNSPVPSASMVSTAGAEPRREKRAADHHQNEYDDEIFIVTSVPPEVLSEKAIYMRLNRVFQKRRDGTYILDDRWNKAWQDSDGPGRQSATLCLRKLGTAGTGFDENMYSVFDNSRDQSFQSMFMAHGHHRQVLHPMIRISLLHVIGHATGLPT